MKETKMIEVFKHKSIGGKVPEMNDYYRNVYSNVQYQCEPDGHVSVLVPEVEVKAREEFVNKCTEWLKELEKEHSVLARKLAHWHHIRLR